MRMLRAAVLAAGISLVFGAGAHAGSVTLTGPTTMAGTYSPSALATIGSANPGNGDHISDIVWRDGNGNTAIWLMSGATVSSSAGIGNIPTTWSIADTGDYNGDGNSDLLWRDTGGNTAMWFMTGASVLSTVAVGNIPITWTVQNSNVD